MPRSKGWYGVDLDGTLAVYDGWKGENHIGEPVPLMLQRVKDWLAAGHRVKIFTARVCSGPEAVKAIQDWTEKHLGVRLEVTNAKDYGLIEYWDDRAVGVEFNTGLRKEH